MSFFIPHSDYSFRFSSFRHKLKSCPASVILLIDLDPRIHSNIDFNTRKEIFTRMYRMTSSYFSPFFALIFSAKVLWYFWHSCPIAPEVVKMSGVKVPCSTWITRWLYCAFFTLLLVRPTAHRQTNWQICDIHSYSSLIGAPILSLRLYIPILSVRLPSLWCCHAWRW